MRAMRLQAAGEPLRLEELPVPTPAARQVLIRVSVCAVCRTDLHIVGGELSEPKLPLVIGHMIVGQVQSAGAGAHRFVTGERIGVPWLGFVDETCRFCRRGLENLCVSARFTGYHVDGGYAEFCVADERFCFPVPESYADLHAAPLLCAGLIGYRALRLAGDAQRIGLYGFGDSAHIIAQVARYQGRRVFAFTSPGDTKKQAFAKSLGAEWAGDSLAPPPEPLDAALIF
ncbi:MAG: alcohol dehydrogenase, partial [Chloroflexi bacterium]